MTQAAFDAHFKEGIHREVSVNGEIKTRWLMSKRYMHRAGTLLRAARAGEESISCQAVQCLLALS